MLSLLNFVPCRAATFFTKVSAETLWKATTSCRSGGVKKGRMRAFRKPKDLNKGQFIGDGSINTLWPGLNAPVTSARTLLEHRYLKPDPHRVERMLAFRKEGKLVGRAKTLHPMERGWAGRSLQGRKLPLPPPVGDEKFEKFTTVCIRTKFAVVMQPRGRVRYHSAIVAMGNHNGLLGFGFARKKDPKSALNSAIVDVPKRLQYIHRLENHTIYHNFFAQCCGVRIFVQRKPKGFGLRCHRVIKALCELCGISDLHAKVDGETSNYMNITKAFVTGLMNQETHQELAERKRLHVVEFKRENGYLPRIVASPQVNPIRTNEELEDDEVLDVEDMYGEAKLPYKKETFPKPFYLTMNCESYRRKVFLEHPYRNQYNVLLRLQAEGKLKDNSKEGRQDEAKTAHEKVLMGEAPMPIGMCLSDVNRDSLIDEEKK